MLLTKLTANNDKYVSHSQIIERSAGKIASFTAVNAFLAAIYQQYNKTTTTLNYNNNSVKKHHALVSTIDTLKYDKMI